ncbi:hypothetical protein EDC04DRAFT_2605992 [Pisolithus marmoratus]|nr:hypothetical protein EDC04DRAFT_2605992 [Pisolithus marmoratus]
MLLLCPLFLTSLNLLVTILVPMMTMLEAQTPKWQDVPSGKEDHVKEKLEKQSRCWVSLAEAGSEHKGGTGQADPAHCLNANDIWWLSFILKWAIPTVGSLVVTEGFFWLAGKIGLFSIYSVASKAPTLIGWVSTNVRSHGVVVPFYTTFNLGTKKPGVLWFLSLAFQEGMVLGDLGGEATQIKVFTLLLVGD